VAAIKFIAACATGCGYDRKLYLCSYPFSCIIFTETHIQYCNLSTFQNSNKCHVRLFLISIPLLLTLFCCSSVNSFLLTIAWKRLLFTNKAAYCVYFNFLSVFTLFFFCISFCIMCNKALLLLLWSTNTSRYTLAVRY
jgi:hypothetical protein